jgi:hypothetical protein
LASRSASGDDSVEPQKKQDTFKRIRTTLGKQLGFFVLEIYIQANSGYNEERRSLWREDLMDWMSE